MNQFQAVSILLDDMGHEDALAVLRQAAEAFAPGEACEAKASIPGVEAARAIRRVGYGRDESGRVWAQARTVDYAYRGPLKGLWRNPYHPGGSLASTS